MIEKSVEVVNVEITKSMCFGMVGTQPPHRKMSSRMLGTVVNKQ